MTDQESSHQWMVADHGPVCGFCGAPYVPELEDQECASVKRHWAERAEWCGKFNEERAQQRLQHLENCHIAGHTSLMVTHKNAAQKARWLRFMRDGWRRLAEKLRDEARTRKAIARRGTGPCDDPECGSGMGCICYTR